MPKPALTRLPNNLLSAADYASRAREHLEASVYAHLSEGSGDGLTVAANRTAFAEYQVFNRILRRRADGHTRLHLWGADYAHPLFLAPIGFQQLYHPEGEKAWAMGAQAAAAGIVLSHYASTAMTEVTAANPRAFYQLYWQCRASTEALLPMIQAAGFRGIMVTVDTPVYGARWTSQRAGFVMPATIRAVNLSSIAPPSRSLTPDDRLVFQGYMADTMDWDDLAWLIANSPLPVAVKGITHEEDARHAQHIGAQGLVVSSHGGRGLDCGIASLTALPAIRAAVGEELTIWLDSGIRQGSDVFKAIALGADAVLIGRPAMYALAVAGALGVAHLLSLLRQELEVTMAQAGCFSLAEIRQTPLHRTGGR